MIIKFSTNQNYFYRKISSEKNKIKRKAENLKLVHAYLSKIKEEEEQDEKFSLFLLMQQQQWRSTMEYLLMHAEVGIAVKEN